MRSQRLEGVERPAQVVEQVAEPASAQRKLPRWKIEHNKHITAAEEFALTNPLKLD